jgi:hypothetical protein
VPGAPDDPPIDGALFYVDQALDYVEEEDESAVHASAHWEQSFSFDGGKTFVRTGIMLRERMGSP